MDKLRIGRRLILFQEGFIKIGNELLWVCEVNEQSQKLFNEVKDCFLPLKGFFKGERLWFAGIVKGGMVFFPNEFLDTVNTEKLKESHKQRIVEGIIRNLIRIHSKSILLRNFTLANTLFAEEIVFINPSKLALSIDSTGLVKEFLYVMKALMMLDFVGRDNAYSYISSYFLNMKEICRAWYLRKYKTRPKSKSETVTEMYENIIALR